MIVMESSNLFMPCLLAALSLISSMQMYEWALFIHVNCWWERNLAKCHSLITSQNMCHCIFYDFLDGKSLLHSMSTECEKRPLIKTHSARLTLSQAFLPLRHQLQRHFCFQLHTSIGYVPFESIVCVDEG